MQGSQNVTIHQFHYAASAGDAITSQMLFVRSALNDAGIGGEIFSVENKAPRSYEIEPFLPARLWNADLVLVHHSHGNPALRQLLRVEVPKALIYHNITPAQYFGHDAHLARYSEKGREQIFSFAGQTVAAFGDSRYNCAELELAGFKGATVFPLLDLKAGEFAKATAPSKAEAERRLLFVGKVTPHKNQALLIQMQFYLQLAFPGRYRLTLAGRQDPVYTRYLRLLTKALGLEPYVEFTGPVTPAKLETLYASAAALVCTSLHEGFCIPLVEAMQRDVPVFALPMSGLRETLGKAGVRWANRQPHAMAESLHAVLENPGAVDAVLTGQDARLKELQQTHNRERVQMLCLELVSRLRHAAPSPSLPDVYT